MATVGYGGAYSGEETINIEGKSIKIYSMNDNDVITIVLYISKTLEEKLKMLDRISKKEKETLKFLKIGNAMLEELSKFKYMKLQEFEQKSIQYKTLVKRIFRDLYQLIEQCPTYDMNCFEANCEHYNNPFEISLGKISSLSELDVFTECDKEGIIIIGGNGSGKSSFISFLKEIYSEEMILIPSQKLLIYDNSLSEIIQKSEQDIKVLQRENIIQQLRSSYQSISLNNISPNFSTLISAMANKTIFEQNKYFEKKKALKIKGNQEALEDLEKTETFLDKVNKVWSKVIEKFSFCINTNNHCLEAYRVTGEKYNINSMSDGEKAILYYIGSVLLADKCSYIVIDEPETYLNPSIYKRLWDTLEKERNDCQFIYISHEIEFIKTRRNMDLYWMKKYEHPNKWEIIPLDKNSMFDDLIIEIYGSKNKIIFCEGTKSSYDYEIYTAIFGQEYSIIPVGGCNEVCKLTKAFNKINYIHNNEAIGIIDYDNRCEQEINKLRKNKIYVTYHNEIEMLLLDENIIKKVLENADKKTMDKKIKKFKSEFIKLLESEKEKMCFDYIKSVLDNRIQNYRINSKKIEDIDIELSKLTKRVDYEKKYEDFKIALEKAIQRKNYDNLLNYCNLKEKVSNVLADKYLVSSFEEQAIGVIRNSLSKYIKDKYFGDISTM